MATKKKATKKKATKRKPNPAFMKAMTPSAALAEVVGAKAMPRTEVTKKLWAYIKRKGLQDKKNRRMINADDALRPVFNGKKQVSMFEMTKLVNRHLK
ncbi:MAG TPA: SWIB/MDM2 domain-containing protein [Gemmatimonadales bacterium]|jgi:chromatin remodeling complex protein RSC6|nr:SWIB/MDM2 domain-containing protein [Gemmatimonadales bacterium]